jgi:hypothetical protein
MEPKDEDMKRVDDAIQTLGDFFDSVQIFATRHEPGEHDGTIAINKGAGNWFARYGQVKEWVVKTEEYSRIDAKDQ